MRLIKQDPSWADSRQLAPQLSASGCRAPFLRSRQPGAEYCHEELVRALRHAECARAARDLQLVEDADRGVEPRLPALEDHDTHDRDHDRGVDDHVVLAHLVRVGVRVRVVVRVRVGVGVRVRVRVRVGG